MSFNGYGKMNSDEVGIYLQLKTDAIITAVPLLYIALSPSRHDTQQILDVRFLGLYHRGDTTSESVTIYRPENQLAGGIVASAIRITATRMATSSSAPRRSIFRPLLASTGFETMEL